MLNSFVTLTISVCCVFSLSSRKELFGRRQVGESFDRHSNDRKFNKHERFLRQTDAIDEDDESAEVDSMFKPLMDGGDSTEKTQTMKALASLIQSNMDASRDPCEDFFGFACGGWLKANPIPADQNIWGVLDKVQEENDLKLIKILESTDVSSLPPTSAVWKVVTAYRQCVDVRKTDEQTPAHLVQMVKALKGPSDKLYLPAEIQGWSLTDALIKSHKDFGSKSFFDVFPFSDNNDINRRILKFEEAGLAFNNPLDLKNKNKTDAYKALITSVIRLVLGVPRSQARRFARNVMKVESKMAEFYVRPEEKVDTGATFNRVEFVRLFQGQSHEEKDWSIRDSSDWLAIDWQRIVAAYDVVNFTMETNVDLSNVKYFLSLNKFIASSRKEFLRDYIIWTSIRVESRILPTFLQAKWQEYRKRVYGKTSDHPLKIRCEKLMGKMFPFPLSFLYQNSSFPESHKEYITALVQFLKLTLLVHVHDIDWMDDTTKNRTEDKILNMVMNLGFPAFITNSTDLDAAVEDVVVNETETIWQTFQKYTKQESTGYETLLRGNRTRFGWSYPDVSEVNAGYKAASNNLEFPAGILRRPLFHPDFPKFWNFGSIASVMGHEMSHGFDKSGSQFDKEGRQRNWWTAKAWEEFQKHSKCFVDFYSAKEIQGLHINGNLTVDENIADVGGISLAFRAFRKWRDQFDPPKSADGNRFPLEGIKLNEEQLFFVAFGQTWCEHSRSQSLIDAIKSWEHCPQPVRAEAAVSLHPEFAKLFNCKANSKMNPQNRCSLW